MASGVVVGGEVVLVVVWTSTASAFLRCKASTDLVSFEPKFIGEWSRRLNRMKVFSILWGRCFPVAISLWMDIKFFLMGWTWIAWSWVRYLVACCVLERDSLFHVTPVPATGFNELYPLLKEPAITCFVQLWISLITILRTRMFVEGSTTFTSTPSRSSCQLEDSLS